VEYGKHNSIVYKVDDKIDFIHSDFLELDAEQFGEQIDVVFISPPWGGTGINALTSYTMNYIYPNFHLIMAKALEFSKNLIWFLPRNTDIEKFAKEVAWYAKTNLG
jgi:tRNA1(Val) A37 N6-methylase TrmN6